MVLTYNLAIDPNHGTVSAAPPSEGVHQNMLKKILADWTARAWTMRTSCQSV